MPAFLGNDVLIFLWLVYVDLITHKYSEYDLWLPYAYLAWGWNILNFSFVVITISVNKSWFQNEWLYKSLKAVDQKNYSWTCNTDILQWWHHRRLVSSIGRAPDCCAGGREFNTGRTNTQGLKINWEEYASFLNIKKWLDILVFSDRDE